VVAATLLHYKIEIPVHDFTDTELLLFYAPLLGLIQLNPSYENLQQLSAIHSSTPYNKRLLSTKRTPWTITFFLPF
jgi:hypothetical protein